MARSYFAHGDIACSISTYTASDNALMWTRVWPHKTRSFMPTTDNYLYIGQLFFWHINKCGLYMWMCTMHTDHISSSSVLGLICFSRKRFTFLSKRTPQQNFMVMGLRPKVYIPIALFRDTCLLHPTVLFDPPI